MPKQTVHYGFESPVNGIEEVKITVGTVSVLGMGKHATLQAEYRRHFEEKAGLPKGKKLTDQEYEAIDPSLRVYNAVWMRWARIQSCIRKVEVKLADMGAEGFMDSSLTDLGWGTLDGLETLPADLLDALDRRCIMCNPGVFGLFAPEIDEEEPDPNDRAVGVIGRKK